MTALGQIGLPLKYFSKTVLKRRISEANSIVGKVLVIFERFMGVYFIILQTFMYV